MNFTPLAKNRTVLVSKEPAMKYRGGDFYSWQISAREHLSGLLGLDSFDSVKANPRINTTTKRDGYIYHNFTFTSEKEFGITANLLLPMLPKAPLVILLLGDQDEFDFAIANKASSNLDTAVAVCKAGYAVLALPIRNFNDCLSTTYSTVVWNEFAEHRITHNACYRSTMRGMVLGRVTMGERIWDISRAIDAITSTFPCIDVTSIALVGNSGASTIAYYAAAIDTRITDVICSSGIANFEDSIAKKEMCSCNYIPNIANFFSFADISGLIAPRKLTFLLYEYDSLYPLSSSYRVYEATSQLYNACGKGRVSAIVIPEKPILTSNNLLDALG